MVVGALPDWLVRRAGRHRPVPPPRSPLRRALLPDHPLAFIEPAPARRRRGEWHALVAALLPDAGDVDLVLCRPGGRVRRPGGHDPRRGHGGDGPRAGRGPVPCSRGWPREHLERAVLRAAADDAGRARATGWRWLVDQPLGMAPARLGADAVAERTAASTRWRSGDARPALSPTGEPASRRAAPAGRAAA